LTERPLLGDLRALPAAARLGLTFALLVMLGGFASSFAHLVIHHENRDERAGLTVDDLRAAYHGLQSDASMLRVLSTDHPADLEDEPGAPLNPADRQVLLDWLTGQRIAEDYDNLDLGDAAPAEIIAINCLDCHSRQATRGGDVGQRVPLDYWDDVKKIAFSRRINPTSPEIVITSMHTHALSLSAITVIVAVLLLATRWPRRLATAMILLMGAGLLADLAGQYATRTTAGLVWLIVLGGALYGGISCLALLAIIVDLWWPGRSGNAPQNGQPT
jgi:hypothetical protein